MKRQNHVDWRQSVNRLTFYGVELPVLMTASRWKSFEMPVRYTEYQAADRSAVARYYREGEG